MIDDPAGGPNPANKNQPDKPEKETAEVRQDKSDSASTASTADSVDGATAKPSAEQAGADNGSFEDLRKQRAKSAEQYGWVNEFARAMPSNWGGNINIHIREGGVDINAPTQAGGDIVGGDVIKRAAASYSYRVESGVSGQLYISEIEKAVDVYVKTPSHQRAYSILSKKHLLILSGDTGLGKRSAAICLLQSFHREMVFEIAPTFEKRLKEFGCQFRQGYLWDSPPAEKITTLSRYDLDEISRSHQTQESHLVITLTKGVRLTPEAAQEYLLEWEACPDGSAVLDKHLSWHLKNESEEIQNAAADLRKRQEIKALAEDKARRPAQSGRLAELLVQVARGELTIEELLAAFAGINRQDVQTWFEQHPQLHQHLQMIALAVLHGSSFQRIIAASKDLRAYLTAEELLGADGAAAPSAEAELTTGVRQWLSEFEAKIIVREISAEYGRSTVEGIIFKNPQFQSAVLAYAWQDLQHWRTPLLKWLVEMGSSDGLEYRIAAAAALSDLSQYHAFDDVLREAVSFWAKADDPSQRRLAAFILMLQAQEKNLSTQVLGLLHHWAKNRSWRLQWTAATAYGTELGLKYPELAVRDLHDIFRSHNLILHIAVLSTLRYLFECGRQQPELFMMVLQTLETWARDQRLIKQNVFYIFWELLRSRVEVEGNSWPTILRLAMKDETKTYERKLCSLFSAALTDKEIRGLLLEDLQNWLAVADQDPEMYRLVGRVLYFLFKSKDASLAVVCRIIADRLKRWEAQEQSQSAGRLLNVLREKFSI